MPDLIKPLVDIVSKTYFLPLSLAVVYWITKWNPILISDAELLKSGLWNIVGLVCSVYSLVFPVGKLGPILSKYFEKFLKERDLKKKIKHIESTIRNSLTTEERAILKEYIDKDTRSLNFRYSDGTIGHLCNLGILYRGSTISRLGDHFDFVIQDFVVAFLKKNPDVLD